MLSYLCDSLLLYLSHALQCVSSTEPTLLFILLAVTAVQYDVINLYVDSVRFCIGFVIMMMMTDLIFLLFVSK